MFVVMADDHDYDAMSQWIVGVFSTKEKAEEAIKKDEIQYNGHFKKRGPNYEIIECVLDGEVIG